MTQSKTIQPFNSLTMTGTVNKIIWVNLDTSKEAQAMVKNFTEDSVLFGGLSEPVLYLKETYI